MKIRMACAVLALFACTTVALTQEAFTIKIKEHGEGDVTVIKKTEQTKNKVVVSDAGGTVLFDKKENKGSSNEFTETTIKREAGKPATKLMRVYGKFQTTSDDKAEDSPLQGMTVLIEKTDKGYQFTNKDGQALEGAAAAAMAKDFGKKSKSDDELDKLVLPKEAVKVGGSWKLDMEKIAKEMSKSGDLEVDAAKSTGKGTLTKAYKKDGAQFGEMVYVMEFPLQKVGKGGEQLTFNAGAKIVMNMTIDTCIDGTSDAATMKMTMNMTGVADAGGATVTVSVAMEAAQTQTPAKKK